MLKLLAKVHILLIFPQNFLMFGLYPIWLALGAPLPGLRSVRLFPKFCAGCPSQACQVWWRTELVGLFQCVEARNSSCLGVKGPVHAKKSFGMSGEGHPHEQFTPSQPNSLTQLCVTISLLPLHHFKY